MSRTLSVLAIPAILALASCGGDAGPSPLPELPCGGDAAAAGEDNAAPVLLSTAAPEVLVSGSGPTLFSATVQDGDAIADVPAVVMNLKRRNEVVGSECLPLQHASGDSGRFGVLLDSTLAAGLMGDYILEFQAFDRSNTASNPLTRNIFLENLAPILFDPEAPDTVQRQIGVPVQVRLSVADPQGYGDIDSVYFKFLKPDGTFGGDSPDPNNEERMYKEGGFHFLLFDDGNPEIGDEKAGDGRFSWSFPVESGAMLGPYTFIFYSRDRAGNLSAALTDSFELVPFGR